MSRPTKLIVNCQTGETKELELDDAEYADFLARQEAAEQDGETL